MSVVKITPLGRENYDTWVIHAKAYLVKNKLWKHCNTQLVTTEATKQDELDADEIAKSELLLLISSSELKQVKNCNTAYDVWDKLRTIYASTGPARKASLFKQLILTKQRPNGDVREHLMSFMDTVDKLKDLSVEINNDLISIIMLYSLSDEYENFRIAIETQETLLSPEQLKTKIIEESDARCRNTDFNEPSTSNNEEALYASCKVCKRRGNIFKRKTHKICTSCWKKNAPTKDKPKSYSKTEINHFVKQHCLLTNKVNNKNVWVLDSGCTSHMTYQKNLFNNLKSTSRKLNFATDEVSADIEGVGTVTIRTKDGETLTDSHLLNTLYIPSLNTNLLSVGKMTDAGCTVTFFKNKATVNNPKCGIKLTAEKGSDGLYYVRPQKGTSENNYLADETPEQDSKSTKLSTSSMEEWHKKLGHMNAKDMRQALRNGSLIGLDFDADETLPECESCIKAKLHRTPASKDGITPRTTSRLEIIHSDVCGPIQTPSLGQNRYIVTFIDDYSRYCKVYLVKSKREVLEKFKEYKQTSETFTGNKIKFLQTDNGTEYINTDFNIFLKKHGIQRRLSAPHTPHQNGIAERKNRTLVEKARTMLLESNAPLHLWGEAILTANYLSNRAINQSIKGMTPYEKWVGRKPCINHLYVFGFKTFILIKGSNQHKFAAKAIPGLLVGYSETFKAFRIYVPTKQRVIVSKDIRVMKKFFYTEQNSAENATLFESPLHENTDSNVDDDKDGIILLQNNDARQQQNAEHQRPIISNDAAQQPNRAQQQPDALNNEGLQLQQNMVHNADNLEPDCDDYQSIDDDDEDNNIDFEDRYEAENIDAREDYESGNVDLEPNHRQLRDRSRLVPPKRFDDFIMATIESEKPVEPKTYYEAINCTDGTNWRDAMRSEFDSLNENKTWELVDLPKGRKPLQCKWVYKIKTNPDGSVERYKARLVVKGFSQKPGMDYDKTFSPVVRLSTIRAVLGLATRQNMSLQQFDVSTAFLNGTVKEEIYMNQPEGYKDGSNKVCKLKRSLYGLKQAPLCWNTCISEFLIDSGFKQCTQDPCLYIGKEVLIALYVDDGLVASTNEKAGRKFVEQLKTRFKITTKPASYFLGMEIHKAKDGTITLDQKSYTNKILDSFGMAKCKPVPTSCVKPTPEEEEEENVPDDSNFPYRQAVGALAYLMVATRPDISYAVSVVSRHLEQPRKLDVKNVKRILRYLKGTADKGLIFKKTADNTLLGYSDADHGGDGMTGHSTTGMVFLFNGPILWKSQKQQGVSLSSTEAELVALTETAKETIWLKGLLEEITKLKEVLVIYVDNESAIKLSNNPPYQFHQRTKHIKLKHFFIRECVSNKELSIKYVPTELQLADLFTKPLYGPRLQQLTKMVGLLTTRK